MPMEVAHQLFVTRLGSEQQSSPHCGTIIPSRAHVPEALLRDAIDLFQCQVRDHLRHRCRHAEKDRRGRGVRPKAVPGEKQRRTREVDGRDAGEGTAPDGHADPSEGVDAGWMPHPSVRELHVHEANVTRAARWRMAVSRFVSRSRSSATRAKGRHPSASGHMHEHFDAPRVDLITPM